ncbi:MAG: PorV/PorQ family protein [Candidatus Latescibacterota bacterium]|nr:PorV/PorQ family protein [Candidatus Latescibacterota bacterium]
MTRFTLLLVVTTVLGAIPSHSVSGFPFLRVGAGARASALAEATTAVVGEQTGLVNPASLRALRRSIHVGHTEWIGDIRHEAAAAVWPRADGQSVALFAQLSHVDGLQRRTDPSVESLGSFGVYEWTAGGVWSRPLSPRWRVGAGLKYVRQSIFTDAAAGAAADVGLLCRAGGWSVGASLNNAGRMSNLNRSATELPLQVRVGVSLVRKSVLLAADAHATKGSRLCFRVGGEWQSRKQLALRLGYETSDTRSLAAGFGLISGNWGMDYALVPFSLGLGEAHRVSLVWYGGAVTP